MATSKKTAAKNTPSKPLIKPHKIPPVKDPVLKYRNLKNTGRGALESPEYDLMEVGRVEDVEGYVRQAFDKKIALMFKEGWHFKGKNPKTIEYIKTRFKQFAAASDIPTEQLFRDIGRNIIRLNNAFLIKVRDVEKSGGQVRHAPNKKQPIKPVAAYFSIPPETLKFKVSDNGRVTHWQQVLPNGELGPQWTSDNVIHFHHDRKLGFIFGTPSIVPVLDDIRALRKIEENIELLVYQHLFPIYQYKIGSDKGGREQYYTEDSESVIDVVRREIQYMPTEGGIVTPWDHEIVMVGTEGKALRADGYMEYFKKRVIAGLGISGVDLGEGATVNRATSQTMSQNLINSVKDIQRTIEIFVDHHVIRELLLESSFDFDPLAEENFVRLVFNEIDIDAKVQKENHYTDLFAKNAITQDEARIEMGREVLAIPTNRESENEDYLDEKYPEWYRTFWKLIDEPKVLIQAVDEPASPVAQAAVLNNSIDVTKKNVDAGVKQQEEKAKLESNLKKQEAKAKPQPKPAIKAKNFEDSVVTETFDDLKRYMIDTVIKSNRAEVQSWYLHKKEGGKYSGGEATVLKNKWFKEVINAVVGKTIASFEAKCMTWFVQGYDSERGATEAGDLVALRSTKMGRNILHSRADRYINRLKEDIDREVSKYFNDIDKFDKQKCAEHIRAAFDSFLYRARFIEDVEERKAFNIGRLAALRDKGYSTYKIKNSDDPCNRCKQYAGEKIEISFKNIGDLPPFHAGCDCEITEPEYAVKITGNDEEEDGDKLERCVLSVKSDLRKRHPDWSDKKIKSAAHAICNSRIKG